MSYQDPPSKSQENSQQQETQAEQQQSQQQSTETSRAAQRETFVPASSRADAKKTSGMKLGEAKATPGTTGERNLSIQWTPTTQIDGSPYYTFALTAGFDVKTSAGNALEVTMQQLQYNRTHNGTGALRTSLIPPAPVGSKGKVVARDLVTGEVLEQPWQWHLIGGSGFFSGIWNTIKRLLWNPK